MLEMCARARRAACCWPARRPARTPRDDLDALARDLRKLAMLAVPLGIKIAYEGLSLGPHDQRVHHRLGRGQPRRRAQPRPRHRLVPHLRDQDAARRARHARPATRSSSCSWPTSCGRRCAPSRSASTTARHFRVFPGEGVHSAQVAELVHAAGPRWATAATTASRSSTTTTSRCRWRRWPSARAARRCGSAKRCCAARYRCPTPCACAAARARGSLGANPLEEDPRPQRPQPQPARHARAGGVRLGHARRRRGAVPRHRGPPGRGGRLPAVQPRGSTGRLDPRGRRRAARRPAAGRGVQRRRLHAHRRWRCTMPSRAPACR